MMISPDSYISEFKDKPYDKLLVERDKLIRSIKKFEKEYGKEDDSDFVIMSPSPDVVYQMELEYLGKLAVLISEKFRDLKYDKRKKEQEDKEKEGN